MQFWELTLIWMAVNMLSFYLGKSYGRARCLFDIYSAQKAGKLAIFKLPSKEELDKLIEAAKKDPVAESMQPKGKADLVH